MPLRRPALRLLAQRFARLMPGAENAESRRAAAAMLTVLAEDADLEVRLELARLLGPHPLAPRHVIMTLAADHVAVSALVLAQSPLLVDGELARMARDGEPEAQIAIACREPVSPALASAIGQNAGRDACLALITNPVAALAASALDAIAHRFGTDDEIRRGLLVQPMLSPKTRVLLIEKLGEKLAADAAREGASAAKARKSCTRLLRQGADPACRRCRRARDRRNLPGDHR